MSQIDVSARGIDDISKLIGINKFETANVQPTVPVLFWVHPFYHYKKINSDWNVRGKQRFGSRIASTDILQNSFAANCTWLDKYQLSREKNALESALDDTNKHTCFVLSLKDEHLWYINGLLHSKEEISYPLEALFELVKARNGNVNASFVISHYAGTLPITIDACTEEYMRSQLPAIHYRQGALNKITGTYVSRCVAGTYGNFIRSGINVEFDFSGGVFSSNSAQRTPIVNLARELGVPMSSERTFLRTDVAPQSADKIYSAMKDAFIATNYRESQ